MSNIVKEILYFQRGQENVRNRTQVKLAATSLECKQAGRFSTLQYMMGGILCNEEFKGRELRYLNFDFLCEKSFSH